MSGLLTEARAVFSPQAGLAEPAVDPPYQRAAALGACGSSVRRFHEQLRDIGEISFGRPRSARTPGPLLETMMDDRERVADTSVDPYRRIAFLRIRVGAEAYGATGWFVGPNCVITAGHAVYTHGSTPAETGWVSSVEVLPAYNGGHAPHSAFAARYASNDVWTGSADWRFDYGAIFLDVPLGNEVGTFGYGVFTDDDLRAMTVRVAGYPSENPDPAQPDGSLWEGTERVHDVDPAFVFYQTRTTVGQSGGPVMTNIEGETYVVAIHVQQALDNNWGVRITSDLRTKLREWREVGA